MLKKPTWQMSLALFFVTLFCVLAWLVLTSESSATEGRLHVHKPVIFPKDTPTLKTHNLVFFGYVGCPTVCTPRMQEIAEIYKDVIQKSQNHDLSVLFINLKETIPTKEADVFAKTFHPDFKGVTYDKQELLNTLRMFQAYYSHSLLDSDEMEHTQFLYFIHKDTSNHFYLNNIYIHIPFDKKLVVDDLIKELE